MSLARRSKVQLYEEIRKAHDREPGSGPGPLEPHCAGVQRYLPGGLFGMADNGVLGRF